MKDCYNSFQIKAHHDNVKLFLKIQQGEKLNVLCDKRAKELILQEKTLVVEWLFYLISPYLVTTPAEEVIIKKD